ncbi:MAG: DUF1501 domain-containing protein [Armatimonadetes bacterium]|nr:DUF1501 domain-containing protein [Armatimonadota bacterium]
MSQDISRRDLMKTGGMIAVGLATPGWLSAITTGDFIRMAKGGKPTGNTVLVVCQFSGGNDGLNMVVPYADQKYYQLRPTIGIPEAQVIKLNEHMGLHPSMAGVSDMFKKGKVAVIQNVGYPNPNRSHFRSMDIWQSASPDNKLKYGWIGRHFDEVLTHGPANPVVAIGLSTEKPLALSAHNASIPCFASLADIKNMVGDPDTERMLREIQGADAMQGSSARVVQQASNTALDAMSILNKQLEGYKPTQEYGKDPFGNGFKQIAQLVATSPATRVIYFSAGGFDTHARQAETHQKLLGWFSDAVTKFQAEMEAIGKADNVMVLTFSEFGRRSYENASLGTDHGAAAPMLLIGSRVKGGFYGPVPDLNNLQDGDLRFAVDFREVYSATLDQWMGGDSEVVLGEKFNHVDALK